MNYYDFRIVYFLAIVSFVAFAGVWRKREELDFTPLAFPNSFLNLSNEERREALNYAWRGSIGLNNVEIENTAGITALSIFFALLLIAVFVVMVIDVSRMVDLKYRVFAENLSYFEYNRSAIFLRIGWTALYTLSSIILYTINAAARSNDATYSESLRVRERRNRLMKLAQEYIVSHYDTWLHISRRDSESVGKTILNTEAESVFFVYQKSIDTEQRDMPRAELSFSVMFSDVYVSIISGIVFKVKETSYTLVESDLPSIIHNNISEWSTDEYHYKDIVEIYYEPNKLLDGVERHSNGEYDMEGKLHFGLLSGTTKTYNAARLDTDTFVTHARNKIRLAKRGA